MKSRERAQLSFVWIKKVPDLKTFWINPFSSSKNEQLCCVIKRNRKQIKFWHMIPPEYSARRTITDYTGGQTCFMVIAGDMWHTEMRKNIQCSTLPLLVGLCIKVRKRNLYNCHTC